MVRILPLVALVLIALGIALTIYQDPQFKFAYNSLTGSSSSSGTTSSSSSSNSFVSSRTQTSTQLSLSYSSTAIIESLVGAGLVGIGLILAGVSMLAIGQSKPQTRDVEGVVLEKK